MTLQQKVEEMGRIAIEIGVVGAPIEESVETVQAAFCVAFKITPHEMRSGRKFENVSNAKQGAMHACHVRLKLSFKEIGEFFRTHRGTPRHAFHKVKDQIEVDKNFRYRYNLAVKLIDKLSE